jgi:hypothetical protein
VGVTVGANVGVAVGFPEGCPVIVFVGAAVGFLEGCFVIVFVGETVGLFVGGTVPISFPMAWSAVLQIVMRLSSTKGYESGSILIPASGPTQQLGIFIIYEQKQDP